jgi:hypothetical protein
VVAFLPWRVGGAALMLKFVVGRQTERERARESERERERERDETTATTTNTCTYSHTAYEWHGAEQES